MARLSDLRLKNQYNVTLCIMQLKRPVLLFFVHKEVGLEMHFIGFQTTLLHADTSKLHKTCNGYCK